MALKASCRDSTAVVRKSCQVQGSNESAVLGRTSVFKCRKNLSIGEHRKSIIRYSWFIFPYATQMQASRPRCGCLSMKLEECHGSC